MKRILELIFIFCTGVAFGQHQDKVDFIHADVLIEPIPSQKKIEGKVSYEFKVLADVDSIFLDAKNMTFLSVRLNKKKASYDYDTSVIKISRKFKKGKSYSLELDYACVPKQTVYFLGWDDEIEGNEQIWTQGQGKYTSHWLPSFDVMEEKVEFDIKIQFDASFTVISNGKLVAATKDQVSNSIHSFDMTRPMSSYLLAFAIGKYKKQELISASGVPLENYYYPNDSLRVEPTYRHTKEIFEFLESEIGIPYPWQIYKQVPVRDFLYAGMENTSATIFSDQFMIDSTAFVDRNYVNVNAHELAHQWFGNLVTEKDGNHHWLHEGFATYYAYLAEKEVFGNDHFYWRLFETAMELEKLSQSGEGESLLNPKASSLTFYEKGAWALVMLRETVGDQAFKIGLKNYLEKHRFKNVTITDFLMEIELSSKMDLSSFRLVWLENTAFPFEIAKDYLMTKKHSVRTYYEASEMNNFSWLKDDIALEAKEQLISDSETKLQELQFIPLLRDDNIEIRQAVAKIIGKIPESLREFTEPLLLDDSYITNELMLYNLWQSFPERRNKYLNLTKDIIGLPNRNVRLLWLTLALVTPEYDTQEKKKYLDELIYYTSPEFNPEIRQLAFQYSSQIQAENEEYYINLIKATNHHSWQFRNFTRKILDDQLANLETKNRILTIAKQLNPTDLRYLKTKIDFP